MERKICLIGNFATDWIKYSDYELKLYELNHLYLVPKEDATFSMYNPFDNAESLLIELLKIGDLYREHQLIQTDEGFQMLQEKTIIFVKKYGLMGFVSSNVYNRDIIGEEHVLLMAQNCFNTKETRLNTLKNALKNNDKVMTSEAYLKLFTPFADEDDLKVRRYKNSVDLFKAEDSPKYFGKRPLIIDLIFSKFYAERLDWFLEFAGMLSEHFNQLLIYKKSPHALTEPVTILASEFKANKMGFTISQLDRTTISWDFDSLKTAIQTIYAFAITDETIILNRCEHCKDFFIALSNREKYCGSICRNRSNVQKSRARKVVVL